MDRKQLATITGAAVAVAAFPLFVKRRFTPWQRNWGATEDEQLRVMPGDDFVVAPEYVTTRAITVDAPPDAIYPWLAQMGYRRGGLYSYDFLDRLFGFLDAPSSKVILPHSQDLKPGDVIPVGKGEPFPVKDLKKDEFLLLAGESEGIRWTWATALYPAEDGMTRLVTRNTGAGMGDGFPKRLMFLGVDLAAFIMVRRWLKVLKARSETLCWKSEKQVPVGESHATR
ncbi:MAG: SRPBCC family protein [bacterium]